MTKRNWEPGKDKHAPAPLRHVTRLSETKPYDLKNSLTNPNDQGMNWTLISRYVNGSEEFEFGVYSLGPDQYHPRHYHPGAAEFYYVTDGSCLITVGEEEVEATKGTAIYLPANTVHAVRTRPGESMTMVYGFNCGEFRDAGIVWVE